MRSLIFASAIARFTSSLSKVMISAGVVLALITFLVGFGVCLHAGAVFGRMWNDWQDERAERDLSPLCPLL